jgi:ATP:corrinoid adenosyltransferase
VADEHTRYAGLKALLSETEVVTLDLARSFATRAIGDADRAMGESALIALIGHRAVDDSVLDTLERMVPSDWEAAWEHLRERRVRLPLERGEVDEAHILAAVNLRSRRLQLWVLDEVALPETALRALAVEGVTKAIRNRAQQKRP